MAWMGGLPRLVDVVVGRVRAKHESRLRIKLKLQLRAELGMAGTSWHGAATTWATANTCEPGDTVHAGGTRGDGLKLVKVQK